MRTLVAYDSVYGHTSTVAHAIGDAIPGEVTALHAGQAKALPWKEVDLLVVGAPTLGGRPADPLQDMPDRYVNLPDRDDQVTSLDPTDRRLRSQSPEFSLSW